eukprot:TRINITY_DN8169_c0_g1_i1.p1 TRINITY_DN8169_c0_g1~~TRINITY_DN8169_c0_g1_i1.p1  ORF type:complete len:114 (+),score=15.22 TRINITY_DN8169_c0_g1_i1:102-443(+)
MGNAAGGAAASIESLQAAVHHMDPHKVESLMLAGVNPNEPIDEFGHTIMDLFIAIQKEMLEACQKMKGGQDPQIAMRSFCESQDRCYNVLQILRKHGACFPGRTAILKKGYAM